MGFVKGEAQDGDVVEMVADFADDLAHPGPAIVAIRREKAGEIGHRLLPENSCAQNFGERNGLTQMTLGVFAKVNNESDDRGREGAAADRARLIESGGIELAELGFCLVQLVVDGGD